MKQVIFLIQILMFAACVKKTIPLPPTSETENTQTPTAGNILLLQVDYVSFNFEGAKELSVSQLSASDSLPIKVDYKSPSDFGSIFLSYKPTNDSLFFGTIIWSGTGQRYFPSNINAASSFNLINSALAQPTNSRFQTIFYLQYQQPINYSALWNAVNKLQIVGTYLNFNKKIGIFLHTPSVGIGNPAEWNWYIVMSK